MPSPIWKDEDHGIYEFNQLPSKQFSGRRLPGTNLLGAVTTRAALILQQWEQGCYQISLRILNLLGVRVVRITETTPGTRLEAVLSGELIQKDGAGTSTSLKQGQYHVTSTGVYDIYPGLEPGCTCFVSYYPPDMLRELGINELKPAAPRPMPESMAQLIQEAMRHPYRDKVRDLYYRKLITDLLFVHLTSTPYSLPAQLSEADIAAVYRADAILSEDLSNHYSIPELSGMTGTNSFKLKKGFRLIFNMGVFGRLLHQRMNQAKLLLETTSKPIKDVAFEAGYDTVAGFITAFRKRFGMTPLEWREQHKGRRDQDAFGDR